QNQDGVGFDAIFEFCEARHVLQRFDQRNFTQIQSNLATGNITSVDRSRTGISARSWRRSRSWSSPARESQAEHEVHADLGWIKLAALAIEFGDDVANGGFPETDFGQDERIQFLGHGGNLHC